MMVLCDHGGTVTFFEDKLEKHKHANRNNITVNCRMMPRGQQLSGFSFAATNCAGHQHRLCIHVEEWETKKGGCKSNLEADQQLILVRYLVVIC